MLKIAALVTAGIYFIDPSILTISWLAQNRDLAMAVVIALLIQPWVVSQID
jgi:hypothetical protein